MKYSPNTKKAGGNKTNRRNQNIGNLGYTLYCIKGKDAATKIAYTKRERKIQVE
jgi:hypothetical protein